jgi:hypothetical protein
MSINQYKFEVYVGAASKAQAQMVMDERMGHDEDYGFFYTLIQKFKGLL